METKSAGRLYVLATPIGNLADLSRRAEQTLAAADYIAAEDTRRTRQLLSHLRLQKPLLSYYEPREEAALPKILSLLRQGKTVVLVTDGGTPGISDPGYRLVRAALDQGIQVIPVPGPSALTAALSAAGLPTDRFTFVGFLPEKSAARRTALAELAERRDTLVFFESPRRLPAMLQDALAVLGDREAVIFRELTKLHEEQMRGRLSELLDRLQERELRGEITVVLRGAPEKTEWTEEEVKNLLRRVLSEKDRPLPEIAATVSRETNWPRKKIYSLALTIKNF